MLNFAATPAAQPKLTTAEQVAQMIKQSGLPSQQQRDEAAARDASVPSHLAVSECINSLGGAAASSSAAALDFAASEESGRRGGFDHGVPHGGTVSDFKGDAGSKGHDGTGAREEAARIAAASKPASLVISSPQ